MIITNSFLEIANWLTLKNTSKVVLKLLLLLQNNSGPQQFSKQEYIYYKKTNTEHLFQYNIYCKLAITLSGKDMLATQHIAFLFLVVYEKLPVSCDLAHQVCSSLSF